MDVEIICIGDELVEGLVIDENTRILNGILFEIGLTPFRVTLVRDYEPAIEGVLEAALCRSTLTIVTGGLGTTSDDITRDVVARVLDVELEESQEIVEKLQRLFDSRGMGFEDRLRRMALFPAGAGLIENRIGQAPGFSVERQGRWLYVLPGVPDEVRVMAREECMAEWKSLLGGMGAYAWEIIRTLGLAEYMVAARVEAVLGRDSGLHAKYRASRDGVDVMICTTATGRSTPDLHAAKTKLVAELTPYVYGFGSTRLEEVVGTLLRERALTLSVAESCTGGLVAHRLTDIPGSSAYFERAVVTYSNRAKEELLGIPRELIDDFGAVSAQVARAMARGIKWRSGTDLGLSITGIAGPGGGTQLKKVGTVFIGLAHRDDVVVKHHLLHGGRERIKYWSSSLALDLLRRILQDSFEVKSNG
ncbi:CinA family nicotinamide mononucleotide deamidase-related protein [bacterium]|nr:CinA family nicotinamide mononucleotide deamidase-related protein [candidate division CSSED10-310 bacterium]